jgi:hypothetical protein
VTAWRELANVTIDQECWELLGMSEELYPGRIVRVFCKDLVERYAKIVQYPYTGNQFWAGVEYVQGERDGECEPVNIADLAWLPSQQQEFDAKRMRIYRDKEDLERLAQMPPREISEEDDHWF